MQQQPTIDRQFEQIKRRDYLIRQLWLLAATLFAIVLVLAAMLFITTSASATTVCLSKAEARILWPKEYLYWYSKDKCWSNRRGAPHGIKIDRMPFHAQASEDALPECCWPKLTEFEIRWWNGLQLPADD